MLNEEQKVDPTSENGNSTKPLVSCSFLPDVDYWKQRCLLAEKCLEESPCDPDMSKK